MQNTGSMFIRGKTIKGGVYFYLVRSVRIDGKPRQRVLGYLGNVKPSSIQEALKVLEQRKSRQLYARTKAAAERSIGIQASVTMERDYFARMEGKSGSTLNLQRLDFLSVLEHRITWRLKHASTHARKANRRQAKGLLREIASWQNLLTIAPNWWSRDAETYFRVGIKEAIRFDPRRGP